MDPRPVRGCPPSVRPALLLAALAAVLLAPQAAARGLDDPIHVPIVIVLENDLPVGHYQVDYCAGTTCVWASTSSSKPCVGVTAAGFEFEIDQGTGIYVQGVDEGSSPGAYGGYSERCVGQKTWYVWLLHEP